MKEILEIQKKYLNGEYSVPRPLEKGLSKDEIRRQKNKYIENVSRNLGRLSRDIFKALENAGFPKKHAAAIEVFLFNKNIDILDSTWGARQYISDARTIISKIEQS